MNQSVPIGFDKKECLLAISTIVPQHPVSAKYRSRAKYKMIADSIKCTGIVEPLVVYPKASGEFLLLDGHSRLQVLKDLGETEVRCILAKDDEAYTYNQKVNSLSQVEQHFMLQKALDYGVSEDRLSRALGLNLKNIRIRRDLLNGICPEAVQLLRRNQKVPIGIFSVLRKMKAVRQVEAVEHMVASTTFSVVFARSLLAVTKPDLLLKPVHGSITNPAERNPEAQNMLGLEAERLLRDLKSIEETYGKDVLALTVYTGYVRKMLANSRVKEYISSSRPELLEALNRTLVE